VKSPAATYHIVAAEASVRFRESRRLRIAQALAASAYQVDVDPLDDRHEWAKIPLLDKAMPRGMPDDERYSDFCMLPLKHDTMQHWRSRAAPPAVRCSIRAAA
jgi:hypothetical protein